MTQPDRTPADRTRTVEIPERTASAIAERIRETEFESVDDYVAFALDQLLRELERPVRDAGDVPEANGGADGTGDEPTDEALADRLESLGYL